MLLGDISAAACCRDGCAGRWCWARLRAILHARRAACLVQREGRKTRACAQGNRLFATGRNGTIPASGAFLRGYHTASARRRGTALPAFRRSTAAFHATRVPSPRLCAGISQTSAALPICLGERRWLFHAFAAVSDILRARTRTENRRAATYAATAAGKNAGGVVVPGIGRRRDATAVTICCSGWQQTGTRLRRGGHARQLYLPQSPLSAFCCSVSHYHYAALRSIHRCYLFYISTFAVPFCAVRGLPFPAWPAFCLISVTAIQDACGRLLLSSSLLPLFCSCGRWWQNWAFAVHAGMAGAKTAKTVRLPALPRRSGAVLPACRTTPSSACLRASGPLAGITSAHGTVRRGGAAQGGWTGRYLQHLPPLFRGGAAASPLAALLSSFFIILPGVRLFAFFPAGPADETWRGATQLAAANSSVSRRVLSGRRHGFLAT